MIHTYGIGGTIANRFSSARWGKEKDEQEERGGRFVRAQAARHLLNNWYTANNSPFAVYDDRWCVSNDRSHVEEVCSDGSNPILFHDAQENG